MSSFTERMELEMRKYEVQRRIFCDRTGEILDVRTAVLLERPDGSTVAVLAPSAWLEIRDEWMAALPKTIVKNAPKEIAR